MRKFALTLLAGSVLVCFLALPSLHAEDAVAPEETICMATPEGYAPSKGKLQKKVPFEHGKHQAVECTTCHHKEVDGNVYVSCNSAGCHDNLDSRRGDDSFYAAFHDFKSGKSCMGCHRGMKKDNKPTGPSACAQCHTDC